MADLQSVIRIIFSGDDQLSDVAQRGASSLSALGNVATGLASPFADLANKVLLVDTAITAAAVVIGTKAAGEARKLESSLADLQKQLDDGEGSANQYASALNDMALKYGENSTVLIKSAAEFKAAGYDIDTSLKLVKSSMDLAIAGGVETAKATEVMNRALAGFQIPASEAATAAVHIGDVLNKAADITKSNFTEIAHGFADLSPIAKMTGLSFEETTAILTKVIDVFGSGSEAANALKSGFLSLVDPSKESASAMQALGVEYKNSDGTLKSVKQILSEMAPAFSKVDESQRLAAASAIFGKEQAAKMVQVMMTYNDAMALADRLNKEAGGSIEREVAIKLKLAEIAVKSMEEAFRQLLQSLGTQINTVPTTRALGEVAIAIRDLIDSGGLKPFTDLINAEADKIATTLHNIAKNLPDAFARVDFTRILEAIKDLDGALGEAFAAFFGNIDLNTVDGLATAIQKIVDVGEVLTRTTQGIVEAFKPFLSAAGQAVDQFTSLDKASQLDFGHFIGRAKALVDAGVGIGMTLVVIGRSGIEMGATLDAVFGTAKVGINALQVAFDVAAGVIVAPFAKIAEGLLKITEVAGTSDSEMAADLRNIIAFFDGIGENAARNAQELKEGWAQATGEASEKTKRMTETLDLSEAALKRVQEGVQSVKESTKAATGPLMNWSDGMTRSAAKTDDARSAMMKANDQMMNWSNGLAEGAKRVITFGDATQTLVPKLVVVQDANGNLIRSFTEMKAEMGKSLPPIPLPEGVTKAVGVFKEGGLEAGRYATAVSDISTVYGGAGTALIKATGPFKAVGDTAKTTAEKIDEAKKKSNEFLEKMEQIASNERIKTMEFSVNLKVESLKADAERVKATFGSIDKTIESTGALLGSLFGNLTSATDIHDKLNIERQIDLENKRRQEALDIQKRLAEAEILRVEAQTRALDRGDALLKIDGTGLEPEIRAFMYKVIKLLRVEMSSQFSNFLLGMGAT